MSLLTTPIVKKQLYLGWDLLSLSKKRPETNLKVFQYQISTSVKRSEKQLARKAHFSTFLKLTCLKNLRVTKICHEIKSEGVWGKLEARNCFQSQPFTKYVKQTLVFM